MVSRYIHGQNRKWLALESARERTVDLSEAEDPRVDACLFCLPPHRLRAIDLRCVLFAFECCVSLLSVCLCVCERER
jgi:septin family protein